MRCWYLLLLVVLSGVEARKRSNFLSSKLVSNSGKLMNTEFQYVHISAVIPARYTNLLYTND